MGRFLKLGCEEKVSFLGLAWVILMWVLSRSGGRVDVRRRERDIVMSLDPGTESLTLPLFSCSDLDGLL